MSMTFGGLEGEGGDQQQQHSSSPLGFFFIYRHHSNPPRNASIATAAQLIYAHREPLLVDLCVIDVNGREFVRVCVSGCSVRATSSLLLLLLLLHEIQLYTHAMRRFVWLYSRGAHRMELRRAGRPAVPFARMIFSSCVQLLPLIN